MAALSSTQSGAADDPATYGVGSIAATDTLTWNNGHSITLGNNFSIGSAPATGGTAAVRVRQGATFTQTGGIFTLAGDFRIDQGSTTNLNSGKLSFNPATGVQYGAIDVDTGVGTPAFNVGATLAAQYTIEKAGGAAGVANIALVNIAPNVSFTGLIMSSLGSATVDAFQYTGANSKSITWTDTVVMPSCGRTNISLGSSTSSTLDLLRCAILGNLNANHILRLIGTGALSSGTRRFRQVGILHTANIGNEFGIRDLTWDGGVVCEQSIFDDTTAAQGWRWTRMFWLSSVAINGQYGPNRNSDSQLTHSVFVAPRDNPHYAATSDDIAGAKNTITDTVYDGGNFVGLTDAGDCFLGGGSIDFLRNIVCNGGGVGVTGLNTTLRATIRRVTTIGTNTKGGNIGETTGDALMLTEYKDSVFNNDIGLGSTNAALGFDDGHIPQTNAAINYNRYFGQSGTQTIQSSGRSTYITIPNSNRVGSWTATAGTNATTLVASGSTFVTAGVIPGDFVRRASDGVFARVASVDSQTQLTLADGGITGPNLASTDTGAVRNNIWSTSGRKYGDAGYGDHDSYGDPKLVDKTAAYTVYDTRMGGPGTYASFRDQAFQTMTGFNTSGVKSDKHNGYTIDNVLLYYRNCARPQDNSLIGAGDPANGSTDVGAVDIKIPGKVIDYSKFPKQMMRSAR